jgi:mxaJ protein
MNRYGTSIATGLLAIACALPAAHAAGTLKVCADPDYLPYSNQAGQGFENGIAEAVAKAMDAKLEYVWADTRGHGGFSEYLSRNLDSGKCDVVMDMPYGNDEELTTKPYYVSSYVFVYKKGKGYDIQNMDSPELKRLKIGFEGDTPVEDGLQIRGLVTRAKSFSVGESAGSSPRSMLEAVENGSVDVMITWQPAIGAFLKDFPDLTTVSLPNTRATGSPEMYSFPMSMAVRKGDDALRARLDKVIEQQKPALTDVLHRHGIQLFGEGAGGDAGLPSRMANL